MSRPILTSAPKPADSSPTSACVWCARLLAPVQSRESFTYLREFYVGELHAEDREFVPHGDEKASDDFYTQLREFSAPFR